MQKKKSNKKKIKSTPPYQTLMGYPIVPTKQNQIIAFNDIILIDFIEYLQMDNSLHVKFIKEEDKIIITKLLKK